MAIRYDKKLEQEINRVVKNFNQKIARLEKQERELLPSRITKAELKENTFTRRELRRKLNDLKRFSERGVEEVIETSEGARLTRYEAEKINRQQKVLKANLTREINRLAPKKVKVAGKKQAATFAKMGDTYLSNLEARRKALDKNINELSQTQIETLKGVIERTFKNREYQDTVFRDNYIEMLIDTAYYAKYDKEKIKKIEEKLKQLKVHDFYKLYNEDRALKSVLDYYITFSKNTRINRKTLSADITTLFDEIYKNINRIIKDYA